jgi:hypothetical protein
VRGHFHSERLENAEKRRKLRIAIRRQRFIERFTREAAFPRELRHPLGAGDDAQCMGDDRGIAVLECGLDIGGDLLRGFQQLG